MIIIGADVDSLGQSVGMTMADIINFKFKGNEFFVNIAFVAFVKVNRSKETVDLRVAMPGSENQKSFSLTGPQALHVIEQIDDLV